MEREPKKPKYIKIKVDNEYFNRLIQLSVDTGYGVAVLVNYAIREVLNSWETPDEGDEKFDGLWKQIRRN